MESTVDEATGATAAKPSRLRRIFRLGLEWTTAAMVAAAVVAGAFLGLQALQRGAVADDGPAPRPPIPVAVLPIAIQPGYTIEERFTGRVEPARTAPVAFERAGLVLEVLADEGATVAADAPLARMDTEPLLLERRRLVAEREAVEADRALSALTEDRRRRLVDEGWTSGQSFDEARLGGTALEARRAALDAAIAALDLDIAKSTIRAPFAGTVARRGVDEGTVVEAGTPLVILQETARPQARIGLPPRRATALTPGTTVGLVAAGQALEGTVAAVTPDLDPSTRTVSALIDLPADAGLVMGDLVRLSLSREVPDAGAWVPIGALTEAERGLWSVLTVTGGEVPAAAREAVEILHVADGRAFVRGTFAAGDRVIVEGRHRITPGQPVTIAATAE